MKIAIITSGLLPVPASQGGAIETLLDSFLEQNEINKKNINITVYSLYNQKAKQVVKKNNYKKIDYIFINNFSNFIIRIINKLLKKNIPINKYYQRQVSNKINRNRYDYIIIENYPELSLKINNHKVIPYIHSDVFNINTENAKQILDRCYKVIAVSNFIKERVVAIDKNCFNKVVTVYNSIDFKDIGDEDYINYRDYYRKKYSISDKDYVYMYSGRLSQEKGVLELVKAFNKINVENKKLLIIGGIWYGSKKKNTYLKELEKISNDDVIYTGYMKHEEIEKILCAGDVGVVPSICNEAAGLSVVEFMHCRNIVVAADKGGIKEYLNPQYNYLVEENKDFVDNLKLALENSYADKKNRQIIAQSNIKFSTKFTVKENYYNIIQLLESSDKE